MKFLESVAGWSPWLCLARPQELINLYVFCNWSLLTQKRDEFAFPKTVSSFPDASRLLLIGNSALVHTVTFAFPIGLWMLAGHINAGAKSSGLLKQGHISMEISVVCCDVQNSTGGSEWPSRVSFLFRVCNFVTAVACLTHEDTSSNFCCHSLVHFGKARLPGASMCRRNSNSKAISYVFKFGFFSLLIWIKNVFRQCPLLPNVD